MTPPDEEWSPRVAEYWGTTDASKTVGNATGHTWTTENGIFTDADSLADGIANTYGRASSWVYRIGHFMANAGDVINASVTFDIEKFFSYDTSFESVGGYNYLGIGFYQIIGNQYVPITTGSDYSRNFWYDSGDGDLNGKSISHETLDFRFELTGGGEYAVDVAIDTDAHCGTRAVPEPTTILLLGSGLVGLAGLRRKFKK